MEQVVNVKLKYSNKYKVDQKEKKRSGEAKKSIKEGKTTWTHKMKEIKEGQEIREKMTKRW